MATNITVRPIGGYYSWTRAQTEGWKWNSPVAVNKTWLTFIQLEWTMTESLNLNVSVTYGGTAQIGHISRINFAEGDVSMSVAKNIRQFLTIADEKRVGDFVKGLSESLAISDAEIKGLVKRLNEAVDTSDLLSVSVSKTLAEAIETTEAYSKLKRFIRSYDETIRISESKAMSIELLKAEMLRLDDRFGRGFRKDFSEAINITSDFNRTWLIVLVALSGFQILDPISGSFEKRVARTVQFLSDHHSEVEKNIHRAIAVAEDVARIVTFNLLFNEGLSIEGAIAKSVEMPIEEAFKLVDELLRGGGEGIFSDLRILTRALTDAEFEELINQTSPTGYGPFVPFIAGDYEYQEALFKVVMRSRDLSRPYMNQIRYEVDLPDLFDKGEATLPASRTTIQFNKNFNPNEAPTLTVVVKAGASNFVPEVDFDIQTGNKAFEIELRDPANPSNLVSGDITWKAQGY